VVKTWKPVLAALVIFAAGVVTGGLTVNLKGNASIGLPKPSPLARVKAWANQRADGQLRDLSRRMQEHLELTPAQRERVQAIIRDSQSRMKALWEQVGPKAREELRQVLEKIRTELNPEQRTKFEELFWPREDRRKPAQKPPGSEPFSSDKR
jgi:Spy/CpxP family protein refolding chaperone